jgi:hypothetical protein
MPWQSSVTSYNCPGMPHLSPLSPHDKTSSPQVGQAQMFGRHELAISWEAPILDGDDFHPEIDVGSLSDGDYEKFGSFDSMDVSNPSTLASSISESFVFPGANTGLDLPGVKAQIQDLSLSGMCI